MDASSRGRRPGDDVAFMERKMVTQPSPTGDLIPQLYRITIVRTPWFSIKLHKILASDVDRYLHDHPWHYLSFILVGSYSEERSSGVKVHRPGSLRLRRATSPHRLTLMTSHAWTLFITSGRLREWGFHTPEGWKPFYEVASGEIVHLP